MKRSQAVAPRVIITGGGTAGHVLPAISVADALVDLGYDKAAICFVGARNGMEARFVPAAGYEITLLPGRGIKRRVSLDNIPAIVGLFVAFVRATAMIARRRPAVVCSVGGYAGLSCGLAAVLFRVPLLVVNVDAVPGATNRLLARFAQISAVAGETSLPRAVVTGAPLRRAVLEVASDAEARAHGRARRKIDESRFLVVVVGGSLGARRINDAVSDMAVLAAGRDDLCIYHVTGKRDFAEIAMRATLFDGKLDYRVLAYDELLAEAFASADVVVSRAGASTVAELAAIGAPSVLVPLPGAPGDHQSRNAESLARAGGAMIIADGELSAARLLETLDELGRDRDRREAMRSGARSIARLDAADAIARLVDGLAAKPLPSIIRRLRSRAVQ